MNRFTYRCALVFAAFVFASCSAGAKGKPVAGDGSELALGTVCSIRVFDGYSAQALDAAFARIREIDATMSANAPGTALASINDAAGIQPVSAPKDLLFVLEKALSYASLSGGAFDPSIGPLVKLWNIGMEGERIPSVAEIQDALPLVDAASVLVDDSAGTVFLAKKGMRLDLGAIAKGYAADEAAHILSEHGVHAAVVDLGGNIKVVGKKPDGQPWRVGIQNPLDQRGAYLGVVELQGEATMVTSGVYERFFIGEDGMRYHHILDTKSGYPIRNGLTSITVIAASSVDADGLSTSLFAMGLAAGMELAERLPDVEAVFVDEERRVYVSSGLQKTFTLQNPDFTLSPLAF